MELKKSLEHLRDTKMITEIDDSGGMLFAISEIGLSTIYNYEKVEKILACDDGTAPRKDIEKPASQWNF
jgi:hypothetical protein